MPSNLFLIGCNDIVVRNRSLNFSFPKSKQDDCNDVSVVCLKISEIEAVAVLLGVERVLLASAETDCTLEVLLGPCHLWMIDRIDDMLPALL
jgi:predicted SPOUT superfamily RNA methylase MTH1